MKWLVDSNVLSEPTRLHPDKGVIDWLRANESDLAVSSLILAELRLGIASLPSGARRTKLDRWFEMLTGKIRCLSWDSNTSSIWADLVAAMRKQGRAMPLMDSLIAASALQHNLVLVTRNARDFEASGVRLFNPFAH